MGWVIALGKETVEWVCGWVVTHLCINFKSLLRRHESSSANFII